MKLEPNNSTDIAYTHASYFHSSRKTFIMRHFHRKRRILRPHPSSPARAWTVKPEIRHEPYPSSNGAAKSDFSSRTPSALRPPLPVPLRTSRRLPLINGDSGRRQDAALHNPRRRRFYDRIASRASRQSTAALRRYHSGLFFLIHWMLPFYYYSAKVWMDIFYAHQTHEIPQCSDDYWQVYVFFYYAQSEWSPTHAYDA